MGYRTYDCPAKKRCGGCQWFNVPYPIQLERKQAQIEQLFEPYLKKRSCTIDPIIGIDDPTAFRTKVISPVAPLAGGKKGALAVGLFAERSHRIVPVESCLVEDPLARPIIQTIAQLAPSFKIKPYDEDRGTGLLRHIVIRTSRATREVMVTLVIAGRDLPGARSFVNELLRRHPQIATVVLNTNTRDTNAVLGGTDQVLFGPGFITDDLLGCTFKISPRSFFQTNPAQTERLYAAAIDLAGLDGRQRVLDAYCGIGTIGTIAAGRTESVVGVERNVTAVRDAVANARLNDRANCTFVAADSTQWALDAAKEGERVDVAFLDPPRSGSTPQFLESLVALAPRRIVYISCGPKTQRRDVDQLCKNGYYLARIQPVDLFAHTPHTENICLLERTGRKGGAHA